MRYTIPIPWYDDPELKKCIWQEGLKYAIYVKEHEYR